jgi:hypothetical protein
MRIGSMRVLAGHLTTFLPIQESQSVILATTASQAR